MQQWQMRFCKVYFNQMFTIMDKTGRSGLSLKHSILSQPLAAAGKSAQLWAWLQASDREKHNVLALTSDMLRRSNWPITKQTTNAPEADRLALSNLT